MRHQARLCARPQFVTPRAPWRSGGASHSTEIEFEGYYLNRARLLQSLIPFKRLSRDLGKLAGRWYKLGIVGMNEELRRDLAKEMIEGMPADFPDRELSTAILQNTRGRLRDVRIGLEQLIEAASVPVGVVTYTWQFMPDGRPISWPPGFYQEVLTAALQLELPVYEPRVLVEEHGVPASLKLDRRHYRDEFEPHVAKALVEFAHRVVANPRPAARGESSNPGAADSSDAALWNVGVLIIGSLYWDSRDGRERWRKTRMAAGNEALVRVPICYGRLSRRGTYTMTFVPGLPRESFGTARVVKCKGSVSSAGELILEARRLWAAENKSPSSKHEPQMSAQWGCVALAVNPKFLFRPDVTDTERANRQLALKHWSEHFRDEWERRKTTPRNREGDSPSRVYGGQSAAPAAVDDDGLLRLEWPHLADGTGSLGNFDLLLATITTPTIDALTGAYPGVEAVARAWNKNKAALGYFTDNKDHGITTHQDEQIQNLLA